MKIHFLGTACGRPTAQRYNSSTAIEHDGKLLMIDCGEPCTSLLKRQGLSPGDITDIFITHIHCDHVTGLPMLLREIKSCRKNKESNRDENEPINLYVPKHANPQIFDAVSILSGSGRSSNVLKNANLHSLEDGGEYTSHDLQIISYSNRHDDLESYAFYIQCEGKKILHTGDLPGTFATIEKHINNLDLLITEAAHLKLEAYSILDQKQIQQIIVSHIRWKHHGKEDKFRQDLKNYLPNANFRLAVDGLEFKL